MLQAIYGTPVTGYDRSAARTEYDLEKRMYELERRVATLESTLQSTVEHRLPLLKSQIWTEIWEERLKVLFGISVVVAAIAWLRLILGRLG